MTTCLAIEFESAISKYKTKNLSFLLSQKPLRGQAKLSPPSIAHITRPKLGLKRYYDGCPPYAGAAVSSTILR